MHDMTVKPIKHHELLISSVICMCCSVQIAIWAQCFMIPEECDFHLPQWNQTTHFTHTPDHKDKSPENSALKSDHVCITDPTYRLRLTLRHMRQSIATNTHTHTPTHTHTQTHTHNLVSWLPTHMMCTHAV